MKSGCATAPLHPTPIFPCPPRIHRHDPEQGLIILLGFAVQACHNVMLESFRCSCTARIVDAAPDFTLAYRRDIIPKAPTPATQHPRIRSGTARSPYPSLHAQAAKCQKRRSRSTPSDKVATNRLAKGGDRLHQDNRRNPSLEVSLAPL